MTNKKMTHFDRTIDSVLDQLESFNAEDSEFKTIAENLATLCKAKAAIEPDQRLQKGTVLTVGANILGLLMILDFERGGVITSKALSMLPKIR